MKRRFIKLPTACNTGFPPKWFQFSSASKCGARPSGAQPSGASRSGLRAPSLEDAARAGLARRKLKVRTPNDRFMLTIYSGSVRLDDMEIPPAAIAPLKEVLIYLSAGRGVSIVPDDSEIELEEAALLIGLDPLHLLDRMTGEGVPFRKDGLKIYLQRSFVGHCLAAIRKDLPADLALAEGTDREHDAACNIVSYDQQDLVRRLAEEMRRIGITWMPENEILDIYFGKERLPEPNPARRRIRLKRSKP
ncbi:MAG: hypothetical protein JJT81_20480 [Rubellimicrobium sp.]|nr:hypothetical protein [Rubellimicrobium sp.]